MFGRQPRLPIDLILGTHPGKPSPTSYSNYVKTLRQNLSESYALAIEHSKKMSDKNKVRFDKKIKAAELFSGDKVLVRNVNIRGKHKLANRWEQNIYVVVKRIKDSPVYVVRPGNGDGPNRTLHRDLLLPCGFLPVEDHAGPDIPPGNQRKTRTRSKVNKAEPSDQDGECSMDEMSDEEDFSFTRWEPEIVTRGPYVQTGGNPPSATSSVDVIPQNSLPNANACPSPEVPNTRGSDSGHLDVSSSDHVIIDMSETDLEPTLIDTDLTSEIVGGTDNVVSAETSATEPVSLRRSERERRPPQKLTYDELGEPLTLAISSFFQALSCILQMSPQKGSSWVDVHEGTHAV
ncbi:uncharacterized protein LOC118566561 [Fundulus heteroclitus]|nr:uncharacterized protein LOC118566561 [Fundulus heteroclitus]